MTLQRVLCFGGRNYSDVAHVDRSMRQLYDLFDGPFLIINGGARGADTLCKDWAVARGYPVITMDAPWQAFGNRAGRELNAWMIQYAFPTYALGFPGGAGTRDMTERLRAAGIPLWLP